jgi:hypothetical protein
VSAPGENRRARRSGAARPPSPRYPVAVRRDALAPGMLGAIALLAGLALVDTDAFLVIRFAASILALIVIVFALQARHWWWALPLAAVAVLWNPIVPFPFGGQPWRLAQIAGAAVFVVAAVTVRRTDPGDRAG